MLRGSELLTKLKELGNASKSDVVRACGYVTPKQDGGDRLNYTAFYEALLEAKGMSFGGAETRRTNATGRKLRYTSKIHFNGNLLIGKAYTAMLGLKPGDEFDIKLERKGIRLIPKGTAGDRMPAFEPEGASNQPPVTPPVTRSTPPAAAPPKPAASAGDRPKVAAGSSKPAARKPATPANTKPALTKGPAPKVQPVTAPKVQPATVSTRTAVDKGKATTTPGGIASQVVSIKPALPAPASTTPVVSAAPKSAAPVPAPSTPPPVATPKVERRPQVAVKPSTPKATERPVVPAPTPAPAVPAPVVSAPTPAVSAPVVPAPAPVVAAPAKPSPIKDLNFPDLYPAGHTALDKLRGEGDIRLSGDLWESALQQIGSPSHEDRWDA